MKKAQIFVNTWKEDPGMEVRNETISFPETKPASSPLKMDGSGQISDSDLTRPMGPPKGSLLEGDSPYFREI